MDNESINHIKTWLEIDDKISHHSTILRELRKEKKTLNEKLLSIMKSNDVECFDCNSGQIMFIKNNVKKGLNQKMLHELLNQYFSSANPGEAEKLCKYIQDNRSIQIKESVKLKKK